MFESEFLTPTQEGYDLYQRLVSRAARMVCTSLPRAPYNGKNASALAGLVDSDFLPEAGCTEEQIAATLRTVVANSVDVNHPSTAAHLHCPPLLAALVAEVVISALNQ